MLELHKPYKRYAPNPDWDRGYFETARDAWEYRIDEGYEDESLGYEDVDESKLFFRIVCEECTRIEQSIMDLNEVDEWGTEFDFPCPTRSAISTALEGRVYLEVAHIMDDVVHSWKIYVEEAGE